MRRCLQLAFIMFLSITMAYSQSNPTLTQDQDGKIEFHYTDIFGEIESIAILKSSFELNTYTYDAHTNMLAFLTVQNDSICSEPNHLSFKFLKFNEEHISFDYVYQTAFLLDQNVPVEDFRFEAINKFQIDHYGDRGTVAFDLNQGQVAYMIDGNFIIKDMSRLKTTINKLGVSKVNDPYEFTLSRANMAEFLLR